MKITVKAKPSSYEEKVIKISDTEFIVSVKESPVRGLANKAVIYTLANYFNISQSRIRVISGRTSRHKVLEIL